MAEVEREKVERFSERVSVWMCVCVCVCVLDHFLIVMRCHVQVINADMFITEPASVLSCVATESLDDI